jgi:hypothetical protein
MPTLEYVKLGFEKDFPPLGACCTQAARRSDETKALACAPFK